MMPSTVKGKGLQRRRLPAPLSGSLRHGAPSTARSHGHRRTESVLQKNARASVRQQQSEGHSKVSGDSSADRASDWFNVSNKNPGGRSGQLIVDDDPPFFLRNQSSSSDDLAGKPEKAGRLSIRPDLHLSPGFMHQDSNGSSMDDFRSVIDDLTVENKKLKAKIRKLESSHSVHLEKDKLFEVKVHGLSPHQKRQLEETLRAFASQVTTNDSRVVTTSRVLVKDGKTSYNSLPQKSGLASSLATTDSRLVDSAYASRSATGTKSASTSNHVMNELSAGDASTSTAKSQNSKVQSFLDDIPSGLFPKHPTVMPAKVKKRIVVKRLEQLFTGKRGTSRGNDSQTLQQQEVSNIAAQNERGTVENKAPEGVREAHILQPEAELDKTTPPKMQFHWSSDSSDEKSVSISKSPQQRPTRPLDLDPDRAQVPSDNMDYIRHLGLSAPQLTAMDPTDVAMDEEGWVYLNLLINMAQLHIINVTPDFIRSAVSEVSTKFQLSQDGKKIRWRGGTEGTSFSSDSGTDGAHRGSPDDSDSLDDGDRKRRKIESSSHQKTENEKGLKYGTFQPPATGRSSLQYKPLFRHPNTFDFDEMSIDDSISRASFLASDVYGPGQKARSNDFSRKRKDGAIVFYSRAPFCTDLSADRENISTPLHVADVGKDGFSNHTNDALGCTHPNPPRGPSRTPSGSTMLFRPFKDYSVCDDLLQISKAEKQSLEPTKLESASDDLEFSPKWAATKLKQKVSLLDLEACGLGGSRPADHFAIIVKTSRPAVGSSLRTQLSKFTAPGSKSRKIIHSISQSSLDAFHSPEDGIIDRLAALSAHPTHKSAASPFDEAVLPVKSEVLSTQIRLLKPSKLPPPINYYGASSSSGNSDDTASESSVDADENFKADPPRPDPYSTIAHGIYYHEPIDEDDSGVNDDDVEGEDPSDDDWSIDMLAQARESDPAAVAALEQQFEPAAAEISESLKATAGHGSDVHIIDTSPYRSETSS